MRIFKRYVLSIFVSCAALSLLVTPVSALSVLVESITGTSDVNLYNKAGSYNEYVGQTFTLASDADITGLSFRISDYNVSGSNDIYYHLMDASHNILASILVGASTDLSNWGNEIVETAYFDTPYSATAGSYIGVIDMTGAGLNAVYVNIDPANPYAGGVYTYKTQSGGWATDGAKDLYFQVLGAVSPIVTPSIAVNNGWELFLGYNADVYADVTSDGGENVTGWMWYRDLTDNQTDWDFNGALGYFATGDNFSVNLNNLDVGHIYEYKPMINNSSGSYNSTTTANFTVSTPSDPPVLIIRNSYLTLNTANLSAIIYGQVAYDGGDNVTAGLDWRQYGSSNWTSTSNNSGLVFLDLFGQTITGLSAGTLYEYRARGFNSYGSYNSTSQQFTLIDVSTPAVTTLTAINVTSTTAILRGEVTDMGNDPALHAWFKIREQGLSGWSTLIRQSVNQTGVYYLDTSNQLGSSLSPDTTYEYAAIVEAHITMNDQIQAEGEVRSFTTLPIGTPPNISTLNATYLGHQALVRLRGYVTYDGNDSVTGYFKFKAESEINWYESWEKDYNLNTDDIFYITATMNIEEWYQYQACGSNIYGESCGEIKYFRLSDGVIEVPDSPIDSDDVITTFTDVIRNVKESLHLTGIMGTWAFMFMFIMIVSIIFAPLMFSQKENEAAKTAIGIIWAILILTIVGAFVFSGELGVWPIVILSGAFVLTLMVIASIKFSGGNA